MRILFISDVPMESPSSGAEQVLHQESVHLAKKGYDVYAITREGGSGPTVYKNVMGVHEACYKAPSRSLYRFTASSLKEPSSIFRRLRKHGPFDLMICQQPFTCFFLLVKGMLVRTPVLYVYLSPSHEEYVLSRRSFNPIGKAFHTFIRRTAEHICLKKALQIMTISRFMKNKIRSIHGISSSLININPCGVDLNRFKPFPDRNSLKKKLGFSEGKIHLLTVRNLDPRMGLENLVRSVRILQEKGIPIHLTIGGEGPEKTHLINLIRKWNLSDVVRLTGYIPSELLSQYYSASDFFILPTLQLEGFGLVTVESMACGTPVLGTPVGATVEILGNFIPGFLFKNPFPPSIAEGIFTTINRYPPYSSEYGRLRDQCRTFVEKNYSWDRHISHLLSIMKKVKATDP